MKNRQIQVWQNRDRVSLSWEGFACPGKSRESSFQILEDRQGWGWGWGGGGVCWLLRFCLNPRRASESIVSTECGLSREAVDVPRHPGGEAESEQSLPGEGALLTHVDLHGHLFPGVAGCHAAEWLHSYCVDQGVGTMPDTACRRHDCGGLPGRLPVLTAWDGPPEQPRGLLWFWFQNLLFQHPLGLHQLSHFLAYCLACYILLCEDLILLSPHLLRAEVEDFSVSAQAAAGLPDLICSGSHPVRHWEHNLCADGCCLEFPWKQHPGW